MRPRARRHDAACARRRAQHHEIVVGPERLHGEVEFNREIALRQAGPREFLEPLETALREPRRLAGVFDLGLGFAPDRRIKRIVEIGHMRRGDGRNLRREARCNRAASSRRNAVRFAFVQNARECRKQIVRRDRIVR
jgi:hypothetical protein